MLYISDDEIYNMFFRVEKEDKRRYGFSDYYCEAGV